MLAALWWGGLSALAFVAVPMLFATLGSPALAGPVAARLFTVLAWATLLIGVVLVVVLRQPRPGENLPSPEALTLIGVVLFAMLLALLQEFAVAQRIVTARASGGNLRLWHGVGSALVVGQWVCSGWVLWRLTRGSPVAVDIKTS
mgnify:CR=1 FL=1